MTNLAGENSRSPQRCGRCSRRFAYGCSRPTL